MDSTQLVKRIWDLTVVRVLIQQQLEILTRRLGVNRLNNEVEFTEPVVRIIAEAESSSQAAALCDRVEDILKGLN